MRNTLNTGFLQRKVTGLIAQKIIDMSVFEVPIRDIPAIRESGQMTLCESRTAYT